jgi:hypothetical protein
VQQNTTPIDSRGVSARRSGLTKVEVGLFKAAGNQLAEFS